VSRLSFDDRLLLTDLDSLVSLYVIAVKTSEGNRIRESPDAADFERTLEFVQYIMRERERY